MCHKNKSLYTKAIPSLLHFLHIFQNIFVEIKHLSLKYTHKWPSSRPVFLVLHLGGFQHGHKGLAALFLSCTAFHYQPAASFPLSVHSAPAGLQLQPQGRACVLSRPTHAPQEAVPTRRPSNSLWGCRSPGSGTMQVHAFTCASLLSKNWYLAFISISFNYKLSIF